MARITVEDCVVRIPNRFELVMLAAQRARNVAAGMPLTIDRDDDKNPVVALREIAEKTVDLEELQENMIKSLQKHVEMDEPEEEELDMLAIQQELTGESPPEAPAAKASEAKEADDSKGAEGEEATTKDS